MNSEDPFLDLICSNRSIRSELNPKCLGHTVPGVNFWAEKRVRENTGILHKSTQFSMLTPNMLSDFISMNSKDNFFGKNLLDITEKDTKLCEVLTVLDEFPFNHFDFKYSMYGYW
jgi:hypothetical protein